MCTDSYTFDSLGVKCRVAIQRHRGRIRKDGGTPGLNDSDHRIMPDYVVMHNMLA